MRGSELAEPMAVSIDHLLSARESALDTAIDATVDKIGRFSGKDATSYLEAYRSEMQMRNILEDSLMNGFPWVLLLSIHTKMIEIQAGYCDWADFAKRVLEWYSYDDSIWLSKKDFMDWVDSSGKGRNASALLQEFES